MTALAAPHSTTTLDELELLCDKEAPEPKEDDGHLETVPFELPNLMRFIALKKEIKDKTAELDAIGTDIERGAEPMRLEACKKTGNLIRSVLLAGQLRYTATNKFSNIKIDRGEDLSRAFNGKYQRSFRDVREYELDRDALAQQVGSPAVASAFKTLRAAGIVTQKRYLKPTLSFFTDFSLDDGFRSLALARNIVPVTQLALPRSVSK